MKADCLGSDVGLLDDLNACGARSVGMGRLNSVAWNELGENSMGGFGSGHIGGKENLGIAHLRHGGYSYLRGGPMPGCDRCLIGQKGQCEKYDKTRSDCVIGLQALDEEVSRITNLPWIRPEHGALVEEFARARIFLFLVDRWLMAVGPFRLGGDGDLDVRSVLKTRTTISNSMARFAEQLGLTPLSRKTLGLPLMEEAEPVDVAALEEKYRVKKDQGPEVASVEQPRA